MLVIGLTGGIGSGKSTVAKLFAELNVPIIDADLIARQLVEPEQPALFELVNKFGPDILQENGELDRRRLRKLVFADDQQRKILEDVLHPLIRQSMLDRLERIGGPYVIMVVPLLVDTGNWEMIDQILVIDVDEETQINRVMQRDDVNRKQAQAIINTQISRAARLEAADQVINNTGDITELQNRVKILHQAYLAEAESLKNPDEDHSGFAVYELPLIERIRTFLRLEQLFNRTAYHIKHNNAHSAYSVIQTLVEINNLTGRGDLKSEIIKELERQHASLKRHVDLPDVNQSVLNGLLQKLSGNISTIHGMREQLDQHLKNDLLYNSFRQRLNIPGGTSNFDLPLFNHWLNYSDEQRQNTLESWFKPYIVLYQAIETCLDAIRHSSDAIVCTARKGYYEHKLKLRSDIQLVRVILEQDKGCYPTISASKHRLNIRFMQWIPGELNSPQIDSDIGFKLMLCSI
jgi:dephospho-CoA kinase